MCPLVTFLEATLRCFPCAATRSAETASPATAPPSSPTPPWSGWSVPTRNATRWEMGNYYEPPAEQCYTFFWEKTYPIYDPTHMNNTKSTRHKSALNPNLPYNRQPCNLYHETRLRTWKRFRETIFMIFREPSSISILDSNISIMIRSWIRSSWGVWRATRSSSVTTRTCWTLQSSRCRTPSGAPRLSANTQHRYLETG